MFRYLILEILVPLLIFGLLRSIIRSLFPPKRNVARNSVPPSQAPLQVGGELRKDPVCGTYVSVGASITRKVDGELFYFCSTQCRDKYRAA